MNNNSELIEASAPEWSRQHPGVMVDLGGPRLKTAPFKGSASVAHPSVVPDPHEPGRIERVSPTPVPPLREPAQCVDIAPDDAADPLVPARGIVVGLLISVPIWGVIGLGFWFVH
jgi:hypothetical protein